MQSLWTWIIGVVGVLLLAASALAATVKVGVVMTYSGGGAEFGQQVDRGMNLYIQQHATDLGGHQVELIKRDAKLPDGAIAKTAVQELITREGWN